MIFYGLLGSQSLMVKNESVTDIRSRSARLRQPKNSYNFSESSSLVRDVPCLIISCITLSFFLLIKFYVKNMPNSEHRDDLKIFDHFIPFLKKKPTWEDHCLDCVEIRVLVRERILPATKDFLSICESLLFFNSYQISPRSVISVYEFSADDSRIQKAFLALLI